jgi:peptidoglycan/xylan/chitin deacetylase (PgdA/CDA1 family)
MSSIHYPSRLCLKATISVFTLCGAFSLHAEEFSELVGTDQITVNNNPEPQHVGEHGRIEALLKPPRVERFRIDDSGTLNEAPKQRKGDPTVKIGHQKTKTKPALNAALTAASVSVASCTSTSSSLINPNFETVKPSEPINPSISGQAKGWCDVGDFGYSRVQVAPKKYNYVIKLSIPSNPSNPGNSSPRAAVAQTVTLAQTSFKNVFIGGMVKAENVVGEWGSFLQANFVLNDGTTVICKTNLPNLGTFDWRWIGLNAHHCLDKDEPIKSVTVSAILQDGGTAYFDLLQLQQFNQGPGAVTIMFDDGLLSDSTIVKPYLSALGFRGSSAVITSQIGRPGYMSMMDLNDLPSAKWDIVSHSVTHPWFPGLSANEASAELKKSKKILGNFNVQDFAWPYGGADGQTTALAQKIYKSTRTYDIPDDNGYGTFPYNIRSYPIYRDDICASWFADCSVHDYLSWIREFIDEAKKNGRWAILAFHEIVPGGPINGEYSDNDYVNSLWFFSEVVETIKNSGIQVINYVEGRKQFANVTAP